MIPGDQGHVVVAPHTRRRPSPVVYQNVGGQRQPTMGAYQQPVQAGAVAQMDPAMQAQMHARANAYARARLMQLQKVALQLPPELQAQLGQAQQNVDPAAAWRGISGAFANLSRQQGYQDPRYYLRYILPGLAAQSNQHGV